MTIKIAESPELVTQVRASLQDHPLSAEIRRFAADRHLDEAQLHDLVAESVISALDELGTAYSAEMTSVVEHMTRVRAEVHLVYERALSGTIDPSDPAVLRNLMSQLHDDMGQLADPETWARRQKRPAAGSAGRPAAGQYPAAVRPELLGGPSNAPRRGTSIAGTSGTWERRTVPLGEIARAVDPATGETYWRFPEIPAGTVLEFESGYRVWRLPGGAIEEEIVAGPSMSRYRGQTRGEEAIFSARDMSPEHLSAAMHRAHGAGSPGLGMDAPYGLALAPQQVNLVFENAGVERWVRNLRDNARPGVEYVYRTTTRARGQTLLDRTYRISAISEGRLYDMYEFTIGMKPGGLTDADVEFQADTFRAFEGAERFTAPIDIKATARAGKPTFVEPPGVLRSALGRAGRASREVPKAALARTYDRLSSLQRTVETKLLATAGESVSRSESLAALTEAMDTIRNALDSGPPDEAALDAMAAALEHFNRRAARWPDRVTEQQIRALIAELRRLRP